MSWARAAAVSPGRPRASAAPVTVTDVGEAMLIVPSGRLRVGARVRDRLKRGSAPWPPVAAHLTLVTAALAQKSLQRLSRGTVEREAHVVCPRVARNRLRSEEGPLRASGNRGRTLSAEEGVPENGQGLSA